MIKEIVQSTDSSESPLLQGGKGNSAPPSLIVTEIVNAYSPIPKSPPSSNWLISLDVPFVVEPIISLSIQYPEDSRFCCVPEFVT